MNKSGDVTLDVLSRIGRVALRIALLIGVVFMLGTMLTIVANIISRSFGKPILGALEIASLCLVPASAITIGYAAFAGSHVTVDILTSTLKKRRIISTTLSLLTTVCSIAFWGLVAWESTNYAIGQWTIREATEVLKLPVAPFRMIWAIGLWILVFVLCTNVTRFLKNEAKE
jgi:TRAP-type C4-dicarboxylate transport system permease small subunit